MPNHIHLIVKVLKYPVETHCVRLQNTQTNDLELARDAHSASLQLIAIKSANTVSNFIKQYKASVKSKCIHQKIHFCWQSRFYDRIIRNEKEYLATKKYIVENPMNWSKDPYHNNSSAK
jgi:hypothetical protein